MPASSWMSITATVENGTIKLPDGMNLPDGTKVEITVPEPERETSGKWMLKFAGCIDGPEDFASEHDHYIHGTPKRSER
jgi:hypothetical protein